MNQKRRNYLFLLFVLLSSQAFANDVMFSVAAAPVVGIALLGWLIIGAFLRAMNENLVFIGPGTTIIVVFSVSFFFHVDFVLMFWLVYLTLLAVYFAFPRQSIPPETRRVNLLFHGTALVIVIIGGAVAKYVYWSNQGGFARWSAWMREIYLPFLIVFCVIAVMTGLWLRSKTFKKLKLQKFQVQSNKDGRLNKRPKH